MKHALFLLLAIALIPCAMAQQQYKDKIFVFSMDTSSFVPAEEDCAAGVANIAARYNIHDINPNFAARAKINSVDTWNRTGKVTDMAVQEIGDILVCQDFQTIPPEMNLAPVYYEITIGGRTYTAEGAGTSPDFPEFSTLPGGGVVYTAPGYPSPGTVIQNFTGSVLPSIPGRVGGTYLESALIADPDNENGLSTTVIQILHVLVPVDNIDE